MGFWPELGDLASSTVCVFLSNEYLQIFDYAIVSDSSGAPKTHFFLFWRIGGRINRPHNEQCT